MPPLGYDANEYVASTSQYEAVQYGAHATSQFKAAHYGAPAPADAWGALLEDEGEHDDIGCYEEGGCLLASLRDALQ